MEYKIKLRIIALGTVFALLLGLYSYRLFHLQIVGTSVKTTAKDGYTYVTRIKAARGSILDRNGIELVGNRASYDLVFNNYVFFNGDDPNESLRQLVNLCREREIDYVDHLPISREKPYAYTLDETTTVWVNYFRTFLRNYGWDPDMSAAQLMKTLRSKFHIPSDWTEEEVRDVIGVRYELDLRYYASLDAYVFLEDVKDEDRTAILDLNIQGLTVETGTVREYYTAYAAHILGRVAAMGPEDYAELKDQGYSMDAKIGTEGLEKACEFQLHGTDGWKYTTVDENGNVLSQHYTVTPQAGNNVELTIDLNLQMTAEDALEKAILDLRENGVGSKKEGTDAEGGAVVAMDVKTGEILACASYPTFDLNTYSEDYAELSQDKFAPLYNRALQAAYPPGSTFKMVTTIAAIEDGLITKYTPIEDKGIYTLYDEYQPRCLYYTNTGGRYTHGVINVMQALAVSCNYYFYEVGNQAGVERIDKWAKAFGLGEKTNCGLYEEKGHRANPETKAELYAGTTNAGWYGADDLALAIGQSECRFTPIQLAAYVTALANKGTRYQPYFINRVVSADYQSLLESYEPTVAETIPLSEESIEAYTEGMRMTVTGYMGTAAAVFGNYPIEVCAKTGTAQHGGIGSDNASFVCFAPKDDPQIAVVVYVEKGAQGGNLGQVAKAIFDVYFSTQTQTDHQSAEGVVN